jgi:6-phosphofructokinase 1
MVALKGRLVEGVSIASAVAHINRVDPQGELVRTAQQLGILVSRT